MRSLIARLKDKAWDVVSKFTRQRDCDENGYGNCVTCGKWIHWTEGDAGHFLSGRMNGILFDVRGIHLQCKPCNGGFRNQKYSKDEVAENYEKYMLKRYGRAIIDDLKRLQHATVKYKVSDYEEIINQSLRIAKNEGYFDKIPILMNYVFLYKTIKFVPKEPIHSAYYEYPMESIELKIPWLKADYERFINSWTLKLELANILNTKLNICCTPYLSLEKNSAKENLLELLEFYKKILNFENFLAR